MCHWNGSVRLFPEFIHRLFNMFAVSKSMYFRLSLPRQAGGTRYSCIYHVKDMQIYHMIMTLIIGQYKQIRQILLQET